MERKRDFSWLTNPRVLTLCVGCLFAGFLVGLLIFGSPWHLPPAWGDIPTWITAIATVGLLGGAIFTAFYAFNAFREQSKAVRDQAAMLKLQSEQLDEQREINKLQSRDLGESLNERARLRLLAEREQADKIVLRMTSAPFPNYSEEDVPAFDVPVGKTVHMALVANESRRPIRRVACEYGDLTAVIAGRLADEQPRVPGSRLRLVGAIPVSSASVIRGGETYGFAFELESNHMPFSRGVARFTDDAGLHWQLDEDLHLEKLDNRDDW